MATDAFGIPCDARLMRRLYRGAFMATEDDQPWMLQARERLRALFRRRVMAIGQALEQRYQWDQAIDLYQHALDIDPLAEEAYQRLMLAQRELGRLADALDIYRRCRETLVALARHTSLRHHGSDPAQPPRPAVTPLTP